MQEQMIMEIAQRIRTLREIMEIPIAEMAQQTGLSADEYVAYAKGAYEKEMEQAALLAEAKIHI